MTTGAGSLVALGVAGELLKKFSGKGLVPEWLTESPAFLLALALGAGATILVATRFGLPVSTTHALVGAMTGAGLAAAPAEVSMVRLGETFGKPLLLSPLLAVGAGMGVLGVLKLCHLALGQRTKTVDALLFLGQIVLSWVVTLPCAALLAALAYAVV